MNVLKLRSVFSAVCPLLVEKIPHEYDVILTDPGPGWFPENPDLTYKTKLWIFQLFIVTLIKNLLTVNCFKPSNQIRIRPKFENQIRFRIRPYFYTRILIRPHLKNRIRIRPKHPDLDPQPWKWIYFFWAEFSCKGFEICC